VLGLYNTVLVGLAPLGALQAGALAQAYGAGIALAFGAVLCAVAVVVAVVWPHDRPIDLTPPAGERVLVEKTSADVS